MREGRRLRWAAALGVAATGLLAAPAVLAQADPWAGSAFTSPFEGRSGTVAQEQFDVAGVVRRTGDSIDRVVGVEVRFEHHDGTPAAVDDECVPASPGPVPDDDSTDDVYTFTVPDTEWVCNGRYRIVATARSNQDVEPYELVGDLAVAVPPLPVTVVETRWDDSVDAVEIVWEPLSESETAVDAAGYRIERAGADGEFAAVGRDVHLEEPAVVLDEPDTGGTYRYRVRSIREGPDGPILSPAGGSAVAEVTVPTRPSETTSTTTTDTTRPTRQSAATTRRGVALPSRTTPRLSPSTTIDTGFEGTLDYGERDQPEIDDGDELAGESAQAIIRTEDEGTGLLAPAAGALVLLGWAGHVAYLNRLAKQF